MILLSYGVVSRVHSSSRIRTLRRDHLRALYVVGVACKRAINADGIHCYLRGYCPLSRCGQMGIEEDWLPAVMVSFARIYIHIHGAVAVRLALPQR